MTAGMHADESHYRRGVAAACLVAFVLSAALRVASAAQSTAATGSLPPPPGPLPGADIWRMESDPALWPSEALRLFGEQLDGVVGLLAIVSAAGGADVASGGGAQLLLCEAAHLQFETAVSLAREARRQRALFRSQLPGGLDTNRSSEGDAAASDDPLGPPTGTPPPPQATSQTARVDPVGALREYQRTLELLRVTLCGKYKDPPGVRRRVGNLPIECALGHRIIRLAYKRPDVFDVVPAAPQDGGKNFDGAAAPRPARNRHGRQNSATVEEGEDARGAVGCPAALRRANLASLRYLEVFDVSHNRLSCTQPPSAQGAPGVAFAWLSQLCAAGDVAAGSELKVFNVAYNRLDGVFPASSSDVQGAIPWGRCQKLRFLILSGNQFSGALPGDRLSGELPALGALFLDHNDFSGVDARAGVCAWFAHMMEKPALRHLRLDSNPRGLGVDGEFTGCLVAAICQYDAQLPRPNTTLLALELDGTGVSFAAEAVGTLQRCVAHAAAQRPAAADVAWARIVLDSDTPAMGGAGFRPVVVSALQPAPQHIIHAIGDFGTGGLFTGAMKEVSTHLGLRMMALRARQLSRRGVGVVLVHEDVAEAGVTTVGEAGVAPPFAARRVANVISVGDNLYYEPRLPAEDVARYVYHTFSLPFHNRSGRLLWEPVAKPVGNPQQEAPAAPPSVFAGTRFHMGWGNHDQTGQMAMMAAAEGPDRWVQPDKFFAAYVTRNTASPAGAWSPAATATASHRDPLLEPERDVEFLFVDTVAGSDEMGFGSSWMQQMLKDRHDALARVVKAQKEWSGTPTRLGTADVPSSQPSPPPAATESPAVRQPWTVVVSHYPLVSGSKCRKVAPQADAADDTIRLSSIYLPTPSTAPGASPPARRALVSAVALVFSGHEHYLEDGVGPYYRHAIVGGYARFAHVCAHPVWGATADQTMRRNGRALWTEAGVAGFGVLRVTDDELQLLFASQYGTWLRLVRVARVRPFSPAASPSPNADEAAALALPVPAEEMASDLRPLPPLPFPAALRTRRPIRPMPPPATASERPQQGSHAAASGHDAHYGSGGGNNSNSNGVVATVEVFLPSPQAPTAALREGFTEGGWLPFVTRNAPLLVVACVALALFVTIVLRARRRKREPVGVSAGTDEPPAI